MEYQQYEEQFNKGYNDGYLLSRFEPDTLKIVMDNPEKDSPYFKGVTSGKTKHEHDLFLENRQKSRAINEQVRKPRMR